MSEEAMKLWLASKSAHGLAELRMGIPDIAAAAVIAAAMAANKAEIAALREMLTGANTRADSWRGIAAAMGYEPNAHMNVRPKAKWLMDRIDRFRKDAARQALETPHAG